ncbi:MAG TPA: cytidylate kinase-like family protein [Bryobacteraceae bacterium]|nr:cytidylate kinase-like family protein [Bryobacteraceae bacterium]
MIRVITVEREFGSGGTDIARELAERLGWKLYDHLLTDEIARLMGCDCKAVEEREETNDPLRYRLFKAFMRGSFEGSQNAHRIKMVDADCIREAAERVVKAAAKDGNAVVVGRGSAYYLRDCPDAFHVFVYAPFEEKVVRLRKKGHSREEAAELAETVDRDRAAYIKRYFDVEWPARYLFDLMINSKMGLETVARIILDAVSLSEKASQEAPAGASRA